MSVHFLLFKKTLILPLTTESRWRNSQSFLSLEKCFSGTVTYCGAMSTSTHSVAVIQEEEQSSSLKGGTAPFRHALRASIGNSHLWKWGYIRLSQELVVKRTFMPQCSGVTDIASLKAALRGPLEWIVWKGHAVCNPRDFKNYQL